jgi:hypothetical protein
MKLSRPIIFLAFEGVISLAPYAVMCKVLNSALRGKVVDDALLRQLFFSEACENLATLQREFDARLVITSVWGDILLKDELCFLLEKCSLDFITSNLHRHWKVPFDDFAFKREEVERWLRLYGKKGNTFIILDDEEGGLSFRNSPLAARTVTCVTQNGLDQVQLKEARQLMMARKI